MKTAIRFLQRVTSEFLQPSIKQTLQWLIRLFHNDERSEFRMGNAQVLLLLTREFRHKWIYDKHKTKIGKYAFRNQILIYDKISHFLYLPWSNILLKKFKKLVLHTISIHIYFETFQFDRF